MVGGDEVNRGMRAPSLSEIGQLVKRLPVPENENSVRHLPWNPESPCFTGICHEEPVPREAVIAFQVQQGRWRPVRFGSI